MTPTQSRAPFSSATADPADCPRCGDANVCAIAANRPPEECWCMDANAALPKLSVPAAGGACYCQRCLVQMRSALPRPQGDAA